jgi:hypothetical protein
MRDYLCRLSLVHEVVSNVRLLSLLHNIYKEKSPDFLLTIKIFISADTWTSAFHSSTARVYYRADNILVLCIRQPVVCVLLRSWRSCLWRKERTRVVTLVCALKTRTQCGGCIRTCVLIFVTSAGVSIKFCLPLLVIIITSERDIFRSFPYPTWTACKFFLLGMFVSVLPNGCSWLLPNCRAPCCFVSSYA